MPSALNRTSDTPSRSIDSERSLEPKTAEYVGECEGFADGAPSSGEPPHPQTSDRAQTSDVGPFSLCPTVMCGAPPSRSAETATSDFTAAPDPSRTRKSRERLASLRSCV